MSNPITWETAAGSIGTFAALIAMSFKIQANSDPDVTGYEIIEYKLISGDLPVGLVFRNDGLISGTPLTVSADTTATFVVRVIASDGVDTQFRDRTFSMTVTGEASPKFSAASNFPLITYDSVWIEEAVQYTNPIPTNPVLIRILEGSLPPGLEINDQGLVRGYAEPPVFTITSAPVSTNAIATSGSTNLITVLSTTNFDVNRPIIFSGAMIGGLVPNQVYYIREVFTNSISITTIPGGSIVPLSDGSGYMDVTLPLITSNSPTKKQYNFTLELTSPKGNDRKSYSITVINWYLPVAQGGPNPPNLPNSRKPTIYNTRPPTYNIQNDSINYGYYVLPPPGSVTPEGITYAPSQNAYIGQFESGNYFSFHFLGHDFDGVPLIYDFAEYPVWASIDNSSGWLYGTPTVPANSIEEYQIQVLVYKEVEGQINRSEQFTFLMKVANNITGDITWVTDSNLGTFYNASVCYKDIIAESDVPLVYTLESGELPPNLILSSNGELIGTIVYQPGSVYVDVNGSNTFTFSVKAAAQDPDLANIIFSIKTFTMVVAQEYTVPTDNLYIKCTPSTQDRYLIADLLNDSYLIPDEYLYRTNDPNFGKAKDVVYAHAYGIHANYIEAYIEAVKRNHYWKQIVLGNLKTAVARDETTNEILYEVVYSNVIDNLQSYEIRTLFDENEQRYVKVQDYDYRYSTSINETIIWERPINLNLGPWYTSSTEFYTSYIFNQDAVIITNLREYNLLTQSGIPILMNGGIPTFYTSLDPGSAIILYPNSLENMRSRVEQVLGVDTNFRLLPLWMTSQQLDGNTLGFTPAWVIAYTKPATKITTLATETMGLVNVIKVDSTEGFVVGRPITFSGVTFGNINNLQVYYVKQILSATEITISASVTFDRLGNPVPGPTYSLYNETDEYLGPMTVTFDPVSYAEIIKERIQTDWGFKLNEINFDIDRFSVDKVLTYEWDNYVTDPTWTDYPTTEPTPDPEDSENFYVIFPRKTILPTESQ